MMMQTLTDAELAVLCAAIDLDAAPLLVDGPLIAATESEQAAQLEDARDALLVRGLAMWQVGQGLLPTREIDDLLRCAVAGSVGFEVMCANQNGSARVQFSVAAIANNVRASVGVRHQFLADGQHAFSRIPLADAAPDALANSICAEVLALADLATLPEVPVAQREKTYAISHQLIQDLAAQGKVQTAALRARLLQTGMDDSTAGAFLEAGRNPISQGVFSALRLTNAGEQTRLQVGNILWFASAVTCWLASDLTAQQRMTLARVGLDDLRAAVYGMVQRVLGESNL